MRLILATAILSFFCACSSTPPNPWAKVKAPSLGPAESIGSPSAGCISGAVAIPLAGVGYQVVHQDRRRFYGHPLMIQFLEKMGAAVQSRHFPALRIGDIGMARGGPMPTGHASHQIGLDADVWFESDARSILTAGGDSLDLRRWGPAQEWILKTAASFPEVDRIFVNPVIKRAFCVKDPYAPWLAKLRPWWGHEDHWHVRLKCPAGDKSCVPTVAIPPGNGCDETLNWWFSDEARKKGLEVEAPRRTLPKLPEACSAVLTR